MSARISIVIPVYNAARYLRKCLDSCLAQTYAEFEIICVNDGSTDGSENILAEYGEHVRVVSQHNQGVVAARNAAISLAIGEFCYLLDSDDWIPPDALSSLADVIDDETDIVFGGQTLVRGEERIYRSLFPVAECTGAEYVNISLRIGNGYAGGKMYRTSLLKRIQIDSSYKLNEDLLMSIQMGTLARKAKYVEKPNYYYFWDLTINREKCAPIESVLSVLRVNRDVKRLLTINKPNVLSNGYVWYTVRNAAGCFGQSLSSPEFSFYRDELRKFLVFSPVSFLKAALSHKSLSIVLLFGIISVQMARGACRCIRWISSVRRVICHS